VYENKENMDRIDDEKGSYIWQYDADFAEIHGF
jgi:hypothetical protein